MTLKRAMRMENYQVKENVGFLFFCQMQIGHGLQRMEDLETTLFYESMFKLNLEQ